MSKLSKKELKDGTIGCVVLIALVFVLASFCEGEQEDPVLTEQEEESLSLCETVRATQVRKHIDTLIAGGVLRLEKSTSLSFSFFIEPKIWHGLKYEEKQNLMNSLKEYTVCRFNSFRVVYLHDAYSGKRLAKTKGAGASKIYTD